MATTAVEQRPARSPQPQIDAVVRALENPHVKAGMLAFVGTMAFLIFVGFLFPAPPSILFLGAILGLADGADRHRDRARSIGPTASSTSPGRHRRVRRRARRLAGAGTGLAVPAGRRRRAGRGGRGRRGRRVPGHPTLRLGAPADPHGRDHRRRAPLLAGLTLLLPRLFGDSLASQDFDLPFSFRLDWFPVVYGPGHVADPRDRAAAGRRPRRVLPLHPRRRRRSGFGRTGRPRRPARGSRSSASARWCGCSPRRCRPSPCCSGPRSLGVPIGSVLGPSLLLRALAAAVIGKMENLPVTFAAAVVLGDARAGAFWVTRRTLVSDAILFAVIILASLLLQRRGKVSRADDTGASTWHRVREVRPIPRELRRVPQVRYGVPALKLLGLAVVILAPLGWNGQPREHRRIRSDPRHGRHLPRGPHRLGGPDQPRADGLRRLRLGLGGAARRDRLGLLLLHPRRRRRRCHGGRAHRPAGVAHPRALPRRGHARLRPGHRRRSSSTASSSRGWCRPGADQPPGAVRQVRPRVRAHVLLRAPCRPPARPRVGPVAPRPAGPDGCWWPPATTAGRRSPTA